MPSTTLKTLHARRSHAPGGSPTSGSRTPGSRPPFHRKLCDENRQRPLDGGLDHLVVVEGPLGPKSTLEYRDWIVVGTKAEINQQIDTLLKTYPDEKLSLSIPE